MTDDKQKLRQYYASVKLVVGSIIYLYSADRQMKIMGASDQLFRKHI